MTAFQHTQKLLLAGVGLLFASIVAQAEDAQGNFAVKGIGVLSCSAFMASARQGDEQLPQFTGFVAGYISSVNQYRDDTFDILPWQDLQTVLLAVLRRCDKRQDDNFTAVLSEVLSVFAADGLTTMADMVVLGSGAEGLRLYQPVVEQVTEALAERGYPTDDLYASLQQFREDQELQPPYDNLQSAMLRLLYGQVDQ